MKSITAILAFLLCAQVSIAHEVVPIVTPVRFPTAVRLSEHTVRIPFQLAGKLITVEASVNGSTGPFIIDTGSYAMVLNKRIYNQPNGKNKTAYSVNRELKNLEETDVYSSILDDFEIDANRADIVDLSRIEKSVKSRINGILGYYNLKKYEVYIDFYLNQITLFELKRNGDRYDQKYLTDAVTDTLSFKRKRHGIIIETNLNGENLYFALDTGAEINQLNKNVSARTLEYFQPLRRLEIVGMDGTPKEVIAGNFKSFELKEGMETKEMPTIITSLKFAKQAYGYNVDGVLGYWFLENRRVIINYKTQRLYFTKWPE